MCNLGQGIEDRAMERGHAEGRAEIIASLFNNGFTVEQIASATNIPLDNVRAILEKSEPVLA